MASFSTVDNKLDIFDRWAPFYDIPFTTVFYQTVSATISPQRCWPRPSRKIQRPLAYQQGRADQLPFAADQFDAAFCTISFLHYPDPVAVLREMGRVLNPGGEFHLADYAPSQLSVGPLSVGPPSR